MNTASQNAGMYALIVKVVSGVAAPGEHVDLIGDARPRRIDQVHERNAQAPGALLDADDLLDRAGPPRAGLHRRIVRHDGDRQAMHAADAGDHAVGGQVCRGGVGEQAILDEVPARVVAQEGDSLSTEQLARRRVGLVVLRHSTLARLLRQGFHLFGA